MAPVKAAGKGLRAAPPRAQPTSAPSDSDTPSGPEPGADANPARKPVLLVLAGVNGAGKSSIGGEVMLRRAGMPWFNPDAYARLLVRSGVAQTAANARAWQHGVDLLDQAVAAGRSHAFETTLGGNTITQRVAAAAATHEVLVWFCGLASPEQHLQRVAARVAAGGHDIAEAKIRERWVQAPLNLINLMPVLSALRVFDNSAEAAPGSPAPDPVRVLQVQARSVEFPLAVADMARTPAWAKPIVQAARALGRQ